MKIVVTTYFLESVFSFDAKSRRAILGTIEALDTNPKSDSLKIHKIDKTKCDNSFRSARVNDDIRVIFSMRSNVCTLLYVGHHEDAYSWCKGKYLGITDFGAETLYDSIAIEQMEHQPPKDPFLFSSASLLLDAHGIRKKDLGKIGIPEIHAENLLQINDEDAFLDYIQVFPEEIQEALLSLETGEKKIDEVYNDLIDEDYQHGEVSEHKDTKRRFHMLQSLEELEQLLESDDFERWTIFLHPEQEKLVTRKFNGPALVEGGPGTGKTILGIHKAAYLSANIFKAEEGKKILICTFSKKLAKSIELKLDRLLKQQGRKRENIDVLSVDAYIRKLYISAFHHTPTLSESEIRTLLRQLYERIKPKGSLTFYENEYREVIEKYHIETQEEYLNVDRSGTGLALNRRQRKTAWEFLGAFLAEKNARHLMSFVDMAHLTLQAFAEGNVQRVYDSIIIDEAQDLEPIKLRLIAESVRAKTNNLLILSDLNQRIFKLSSWKKDVGSNIVGRTHYLSINYRTTKQISDYARRQFISSEMVTAHIREYKSIINGDPPTVERFQSQQSQQQYIVSVIKQRLEYCEPEHICVICPTNDDCTKISGILDYMGIKSVVLSDDLIPELGNGVCVCSMNGVKGLEFKIVIIYNYNRIDRGPAISEAGSPIIEMYRKLSECAKYVAATRARDELIITYMDEENN